jgi:exopolysaccharide biosynthesis polyprenyl glycosylphosphotransferase
MLGRIERLSEVIDRTRATDVVVALARPLSRKLREQLRRLSTSGRNVQIHWIGEGGDATIAPSPGQFGAGSAALPWSLLWQRTAKRAVDIVGSAIGLLLLSPILLTVALAILLTSGRPIFYTQQRVGQRGRRFHIWKFRSMRTDAEQATGPIWAEDHDRRCTRIGDWLRHTNIDELPQLWNVLCGDMSLVGPRPERPCFVDEFNAQHSDYDLRHAVPSGLTGWAQVHGWRGKTSLRKRIQYDLDYINRWSFWIDLKILLMTIEHVVFGKTNWAPRKTEK